jgi:hypothetical protein
VAISYGASVTAHVFISYSHEHDRDYVEQLAAFLTKQGIPVWFDREIVGGTRWADVIAQKINDSAAVLVVMSPGAAQSRWVGREIGWAEGRGKTIIPLLRAGDPFFRVSDIQFVDATGGQMPGPAVLSQLREHLAAVTAGQPAHASGADSLHASTPVQRPPVAAPPQTAPTAPSSGLTVRRRRRTLWVGFVAALLVIGIVIPIWFHFSEPASSDTSQAPPTGPASTQPTNSQPTPVSGLIQIVNAASGRCLHDNIPSVGVHLADCSSDHNRVFWTLFSDGTIVSDASGRCLQVSDATPHNGTGIIVVTCTGAANQRWDLSSRNAGQFTVHVGSTTMCLYADPATINTNATNVWVWTCEAGSANQEWSVS